MVKDCRRRKDVGGWVNLLANLFFLAAVSDAVPALANQQQRPNPFRPAPEQRQESASLIVMVASFDATAAGVAALLDAGADPNARTETGGTALHVAAMVSSTPAVVTALLNAGADPNARNELGATPLHFAARSSKTPAVVSALLDAGVDPDARDQYGDTPWDVLPENSPLRGTDAYRRLNDARVQ